MRRSVATEERVLAASVKSQLLCGSMKRAAICSGLCQADPGAGSATARICAGRCCGISNLFISHSSQDDAFVPELHPEGIGVTPSW
jgi:hypothetical protein